MKRILALLSLACLTLLSACNTVQGAGKDIERGGEKLQGAAEDAKK
ncbi:entericidin A/B family lipoprotein [Chitiniphilus purpureus]|uniref:Entericidin A/B family lipoprotein n=1 Tax=Chitiniphilus purpureus TaxID=2981137 RepID=A0ABY6DP00_9NEIS|nr:entericidin A/B family lipoprotein [Chitiniphilus sp. CD1]UXY15398.1 entericidin A/B family lipoprotein [Chitiniphilus sp. CD1]